MRMPRLLPFQSSSAGTNTRPSTSPQRNPPRYPSTCSKPWWKAAAQQLAQDVLVDIFSCITAANFGAPGIAALAPTAFDSKKVLSLREAGRKGKGLLRRFKVRIHVVDSTVIQLVANCMDWAKHRRRKAAAKMHLRLNLHSFLPSFAIVDTASHHDNKRAREVCSGIAEGEIVVFDKAYVDFEHLFDLDQRGVWRVTRAKDNMKFRVVKHHTKGNENIVKDQIIALQGKHKGMKLRRVEACVEVDGDWRVMVFITNNTEWSPRSVCDLYRRR
jgi:hypothetical protein